MRDIRIEEWVFMHKSLCTSANTSKCPYEHTPINLTQTDEAFYVPERKVVTLDSVSWWVTQIVYSRCRILWASTFSPINNTHTRARTHTHTHTHTGVSYWLDWVKPAVLFRYIVLSLLLHIIAHLSAMCVYVRS